MRAHVPVCDLGRPQCPGAGGGADGHADVMVAARGRGADLAARTVVANPAAGRHVAVDVADVQAAAVLLLVRDAQAVAVAAVGARVGEVVDVAGDLGAACRSRAQRFADRSVGSCYGGLFWGRDFGLEGILGILCTAGGGRQTVMVAVLLPATMFCCASLAKENISMED